jgi:hypothetical protein
MTTKEKTFAEKAQQWMNEWQAEFNSIDENRTEDRNRLLRYHNCLSALLSDNPTKGDPELTVYKLVHISTGDDRSFGLYRNRAECFEILKANNEIGVYDVVPIQISKRSDIEIYCNESRIEYGLDP